MSRGAPWFLAGLAVGLAALWVLGDRAPGPPPDVVLARVRAADEAPPVAPDGRPWPNFLVVVADDVGQDMIGSYGAHPDPPKTPHLDELAAVGISFDHAIVNPVCSPTRATLLTGRHAWRYGVGSAIPPKPGWDLPETERIVARALDEGTGGAYTSVVLGKWHLATPDRGGYRHPLTLGFDHHLGSMGNLHGVIPGTGVVESYTYWARVVDGQVGPARGYVTSVTVDDALRMVRELPEPWFLLVALHAAHFPMHTPPPDLVHTPVDARAGEGEQYRAMVESIDVEVGRLLAGVPPGVRGRTDVVFLGDNGSAPVGVRPPWRKEQSKGALTRGGVRVPFIVAGPDVPSKGARTDALVSGTDLFATMLELARVDEPPPEDSISFAPVLADPSARPRAWAYAEHFGPNGPGEPETWDAMVRDERYKVVVDKRGLVAMYDLVDDPMEERSLLDGPVDDRLAAARDRLLAELPEGLRRGRRGR